jgi:hypothetical protein
MADEAKKGYGYVSEGRVVKKRRPAGSRFNTQHDLPEVQEIPAGDGTNLDERQIMLLVRLGPSCWFSVMIHSYSKKWSIYNRPILGFYFRLQPSLESLVRKGVITYELLSHAIKRSNNIVSLFKELENIRIDD